MKWATMAGCSTVFIFSISKNVVYSYNFANQYKLLVGNFLICPFAICSFMKFSEFLKASSNVFRAPLISSAKLPSHDRSDSSGIHTLADCSSAVHTLSELDEGSSGAHTLADCSSAVHTLSE